MVPETFATVAVTKRQGRPAWKATHGLSRVQSHFTGRRQVSPDPAQINYLQVPTRRCLRWRSRAFELWPLNSVQGQRH